MTLSPGQGNPSGSTTTSNQITSQSNNNNNTTAIINFKRGIKRDPSAFPKLKSMSQWSHFEHSVLANARMMEVSNVLQEHYVPQPGEETTLFMLQRDFMYSVFVQSIVVDIGQSIVREHKDDGDAQAVWTKLKAAATESTSASIEITELIQKLTSTLHLDEHWKGTSVGFLLH